MNTTYPRIHLKYGHVTGTRQDGVSIFQGIPFAQAPVGSLRFAAPLPALPFGERDCRQKGPLAPQLPSRLADVMGPLNDTQSEDCLHLTVYTPATKSERKPVVIWLHGGAWQSGGGALDWYNAAALAAHGDVIVVAPNYRLAALGWLYVPGETANVGLLDQELAIQWVHNNIEAFGGDPESITVMGQSAGGSCAVALLARKPLFQRIILQSASLGRGFRLASDAARLSALVLDAAGAESLEHARSLPATKLLQAQRAPAVLNALQSDEIGRALFCPVIDGDIIANDIAACRTLAAGRADVLAGFTLNEMAAFPNVQINSASQHAGEEIFGAPTRLWAQAATQAGRHAWTYRFDYAPSQRFGACHCIELPFLFDTFKAFSDAPMLEGANANACAVISKHMQSNWSAFIHGKSPSWAPFPHINIINHPKPAAG